MTVQKAGSFWDQEVAEPTHQVWRDHPLISAHVLSLVGGGVMRWPLDWFRERYPGKSFGRGLSIGCGTGALERDVIRLDLCERIDAFDGSVHSLRIARREAETAGCGERIGYFAADFNEPFFPRDRYDVVFFHQSLHHVAKLEKLLRRVLLSLRPGGLLYLDEYVGPSRTDWTADLLAEQRRVYAAIPAELKITEELRDPVQWEDPSEAFRSGEILEQLKIGFDIEELRGYGGNLLALVCPIMKLDKVDDALVRSLIEKETQMVETSPPYYAVIVARPKTGLRGALASIRYFAEPKLRRVLRNLRGQS